MARAKRTSDRSDARRRYRLTQMAADDGDAAADSPPAASTAAAPAAGRAPVGRPSFTAAFRNAYHRANVREDLPLLPSLLRHWSFWVPLLLMVGSSVAFALLPAQPIPAFLYQTFVLPPALIVLFICGFFAKRASYLLGAILGVANVIIYTGILLYAVQTGLAPRTDETNAQLQATFLNALLFSPPSGVLFCSLAAWYKRFLALTNPNRGRQPTTKGKAKPRSGR